MILFDDWSIRSDERLLARQFDHLSRTLAVVGNIPEEWEWAMLVQVGEAMDIIPLERGEGQLYAVLTAQQLCVDGYYTMQLRATKGEEVRHTNTIRVYIPASLSGDVQWPVLPGEFTQLEQRLCSLVQNPPIIGENGNWWVWNGTGYEDTYRSPVEELLAVLPSGDEVSY
ncbi:MAG: hypothetical protein IKK17_08120 [Oscillospiraceae bacterium]|nr:hypothetical protein [Oscillospiraceae bacterium]